MQREECVFLFNRVPQGDIHSQFKLNSFENAESDKTGRKSKGTLDLYLIFSKSGFLNRIFKVPLQFEIERHRNFKAVKLLHRWMYYVLNALKRKLSQF